MITAEGAREIVRLKGERDDAEERARRDQRALQRQRDELKARDLAPAELEKIEVAIKRAGDAGKLEVDHLLPQDYLGECLAKLTKEALEGAGFGVFHREVFVEEFRGGYDYPGYPAHTNHSLSISWRRGDPFPSLSDLEKAFGKIEDRLRSVDRIYVHPGDRDRLYAAFGVDAESGGSGPIGHLWGREILEDRSPHAAPGRIRLVSDPTVYEPDPMEVWV